MKGKKECFKVSFTSGIMSVQAETRTLDVIREARLSKASDDESSRALVNVLWRDLKDTLAFAVAAVMVVAAVILAEEDGVAVE